MSSWGNSWLASWGNSWGLIGSSYAINKGLAYTMRNETIEYTIS